MLRVMIRVGVCNAGCPVSPSSCRFIAVFIVMPVQSHGCVVCIDGAGPGGCRVVRAAALSVCVVVSTELSTRSCVRSTPHSVMLKSHRVRLNLKFKYQDSMQDRNPSMTAKRNPKRNPSAAALSTHSAGPA